MTTACARPRIPVTVIGGFLGAGKTSMLNHLLMHASGRRTAVLVNDFGSINIDRALIASQGSQAVELTNGCVCCQIGDDLTDALIAVLASPRPPEAIVIEASGVSDPWRIAQVALADPALALEAVLVLVDAAMLPTQAADPLLADTVQRQLHGADLLVVNKVDLISDDDRAALADWLQKHFPDTPRIDAVGGRVPNSLLAFPLAAHRHHGQQACPQCNNPGREHHHEHGHSIDHGTIFSTWSMTCAPLFSAKALRALINAMPAGVLRLKGLVRTDEHGLAEFQYAGRHGSLRAARGADPAVADTLVAIGLQDRMETRALEAAFAAAAAAKDLAA